MASTTQNSFLMVQDNTVPETPVWKKLIDIKDFPDLGASPEQVDATTLSNAMYVYESGIQTVEALSFTANYDPTDYKTLRDMTGVKQNFAVWFDASSSAEMATPTGTLGKFPFSGTLAVFVVGGGVNAIRDMSITITPSTDIGFDDGTTP